MYINMSSLLSIGTLSIVFMVFIFCLFIQMKLNMMQQQMQNLLGNTSKQIDNMLEQVQTRLNQEKTKVASNVQLLNNNDMNYNYAKNIVDSEGDLDKVVNDCHISYGEAELISALKYNDDNT